MADVSNAAEPEGPRRRRYQFKLRTLLIAVVLLSTPLAWIGWQVKVVRERAQERTWLRHHGVLFVDESWGDQRLPWPRDLLGDQRVYSIWLPAKEPVDKSLSKRAAAAFPEAQQVYPGWHLSAGEPVPVELIK